MGDTYILEKTSSVKIDGTSKLYKGMDNENSEILVARYHSLSVVEDTLPEELVVTGRADDGEIMSVEDPVNKVYGVQYHPESVLTPRGKELIRNLLG